MKKLLLFSTLVSLLIFVNPYCHGQKVGISVTGADPDPSSILDIDVTGMSSKAGLLIPRMSTTERNAIANPAESLQIFNTTTKCLEMFVSGGWYVIACPSACPNPPTTANAGIDQNLCNVTTTTLAGNVPTAGIGTWSVISGTVTVTTPSSATSGVTGLGIGASATLAWTISNIPCTPSRDYVVINTASCCGTFVDARDSKSYNAVLIGTQCWMKENLNYGTYVAIHSGAQAAGTKYCQNLSGVNDASCPLGGLYEWAVMMNGSAGCNGTGASQPACTTPVQGICPSGWHVPSHYEWKLLEKNAGTNPGAFPYDVLTTGWRGTDEGGNLKQTGTSNWTTPNTGATDSKSFTALPGGFSLFGSFNTAGIFALLWSSTEYGTDAWSRDFAYDDARVFCNTGLKAYGNSIRCVKD